jgi:glycosyltransferase involved in cell wall biosynthesis
MKVAHLVSTFPPYKGGMGNAAAQFAKLYSLHHEVTVFTPCYRGGVPPEVPFYKVEWLTSPCKYGNAAGLPQLLWRLRPFEIIHLHYPFYGAHLAVLLASIIWRRKLVLHYHMDSLATGIKGAIFKFNRRFVLPLLARRAEVIIGASLDFIAHSQISAVFQKYPEKFREIPFWVDSDKFRPVEDIQTEGVMALFVGGLDQAHYFKGVAILLRAMKTVIMKSSRPIRLRLVGSGELLGYYRQLASELGIADRVEFLGKVNDEALIRAYQEASFLVLPSVNQGEAFGLVLLEAMSSGKPVIASNLPGVRSVYVDGESGLVVRVGDVDDLAEKILRLAVDDEMRKQMGRRARAAVLQKYQVDHVAQQIEAICRQLDVDKG